MTQAQKFHFRAGELSARTFLDYKIVTHRLSAIFGLTRLVDDLAADEFERLHAKTATTLGPVALSNVVQRTRCVFKYAYDTGRIDKPIRFGTLADNEKRKVHPSSDGVEVIG